jgi:hypothetical protein
MVTKTEVASMAGINDDDLHTNASTRTNTMDRLDRLVVQVAGHGHAPPVWHESKCRRGAQLAAAVTQNN